MGGGGPSLIGLIRGEKNRLLLIWCGLVTGQIHGLLAVLLRPVLGEKHSCLVIQLGLVTGQKYRLLRLLLRVLLRGRCRLRINVGRLLGLGRIRLV